MLQCTRWQARRIESKLAKNNLTMQNQTTFDKRLTLIKNLVRIGHTPEAAERLLRRAEETADILAAREESGEPSHGMDGEAEMIAEDFEVFLPAVWEFAIAGHTGGGQS